MLFLLLCLLTIGLVISFVQKYILRLKEPNIEELRGELKQLTWFKEWMKDPETRGFLETSMKTGLLSDPYYVRKIIDQEEHREGFIIYMLEKTKK
ncbi:hypothetical protein [Sutcliffiella deserti]|uniref:hypothetical protein n=1 Tax=Sutcliffiella deserti TaxID=2875501 RepID=UPI001CC1C1C0|nr:hypothetical protein [Sutcliffiella deserti]